MAQKMVIGPNYFVAFASGQGTLASAAYFTYSPDLDATLLTLFNTVNLHTDEINAVQGPVGILPLDIMQYDDSILRPTPVVSGLIGIDSYFPTIQANPNDNRVDVRAGVALAASDRVNQPTPVTLTATYSGGGDTLERFLAISNQGVPTLETLADQQVVDLWHFDLDSGSVLSNPTRLANVLFDGDDYDQLRIRRGTTPFFEGIDSVEFFDGGGGADTIVRTVGDWTADGFAGGQTVNVDGSTLNDKVAEPLISVTASTLTFGSASAIFVAEGPVTGIRITAGHFRYSDFDQFHERIEQLEDILAGLDPDSLRILFPAGTAALPSIATVDDLITGIYWPAANEVALTAGGVHVVRAHGGSAEPEQLRAVDGTLVNPAYSFQTDPTKGMRSPGVNQLALVVDEKDYISLDPNGCMDLPEQARVKMVRSAAQSILENTPTFVSFTAADAWDIGNLSTNVWHDHTAGATADQEATVPTGCDGLYTFIAEYAWADPPAVTVFTIEILVNAATVAKVILGTGREYADAIPTEFELVATDVVRLRVTQDDTTGGTAALDLNSASLSIRKVA